MEWQTKQKKKKNKSWGADYERSTPEELSIPSPLRQDVELKSQPLCLLLYSLCLSSPAASLWLLPCVWVHVHVCVVRLLSEQQEYIITQTKGAGLLFMNYQPSKANKGPYFHRKLHFHFSSIWLPEQEKIKRPLRSQRLKGIHSSFVLSFSSSEKVSLLLSFQKRRQKWVFRSKPTTKKIYCSAILYNKRAGGKRRSPVLSLSSFFCCWRGKMQRLEMRGKATSHIWIIASYWTPKRQRCHEAQKSPFNVCMCASAVPVTKQIPVGSTARNNTSPVGGGLNTQLLFPFF